MVPAIHRLQPNAPVAATVTTMIADMDILRWSEYMVGLWIK